MSLFEVSDDMRKIEIVVSTMKDGTIAKNRAHGVQSYQTTSNCNSAEFFI
jgi:hypothetical protein